MYVIHVLIRSMHYVRMFGEQNYHIDLGPWYSYKGVGSGSLQYCTYATCRYTTEVQLYKRCAQVVIYWIIYNNQVNEGKCTGKVHCTLKKMPWRCVPERFSLDDASLGQSVPDQNDPTLDRIQMMDDHKSYSLHGFPLQPCGPPGKPKLCSPIPTHGPHQECLSPASTVIIEPILTQCQVRPPSKG